MTRAPLPTWQVPADSRTGALTPGDVIIEIESRRYSESPLILQGPGSGIQLTAAGLFADLLRLSRSLVEWSMRVS